MSTFILLRMRQLKALSWKNIKIYYTEAPVLIFGVLFPFCLFLAFALGRDIPLGQLLPGLLGITLFFTGSSVGPFIAPWETRTRTLERLVSSPAPFYLIILGDITAGCLFGLGISVLLLVAGILILGLEITSLLYIAVAIILGSFAFAALGTLFSALPTDKPANVMMLSNVVRLPLLFISGIFVPLTDLPVWGRLLATISPLSYIVDLLHMGLGGDHYFPLWLNLLMSLFFTLLILGGSMLWHRKSLVKRL